MPNYYRFEQQFFDYFKNLERNIKASPIYLGLGSGGGANIIGTLPQGRVSYDTLEKARNSTSTVPTLIDNLNHIRYDIVTLQDAYLSGAGAPSGGGLTQGHLIYDDTIELTQREKLIIVGNGVTVVDNESNDSTDVTIEPTLSFPDLTDTPSGIYTTESGKYIRINSDGTALEYGTSPVWGNQILRFDAGGEVSDQYDATEAGLLSALDDSVNGDVILLPPKTITIANDGVTANGTGGLRVPDGVTVRGQSRDRSIISANITTTTATDMCLLFMEGSSYLENLTVNYTRDSDHLVYAIYGKTGDTYGIGVTLSDITAIATGPHASALSIQIYNASDRIRVPIDNCCFMSYGGDDSTNRLYGYSLSNKEPIIIRNSAFYTDDSQVESGTTTIDTFGLVIYGNTITNELILENCRIYSHITDPHTEYTTAISRGLSVWNSFDYTINNCTAAAVNDSTCNQAGAYAIETISSKINNCVGIATGNSTLTGTELTDYYSYSTYGLTCRSSRVIGGYFEGIDNNTGRALGISVKLTADAPYFYNVVAKGNDGDFYIHNADNIYLHSCQYDTITKYSTPTGLQNVNYLEGDRGTYEVEEYHASDIENDLLTRHLPLPTISGYVPVVRGGKWVLDSGAGRDTFLSLEDTPFDYTGMAEKVVVVNDMENGLNFVTLSGGVGSGSGANDKVKVSINDIQESYLLSKLVAGSGIIVSEIDDGGFETLSVATDGAGGAGGDKIVRYDSGGDPLDEYDATESGLTTALADAVSGDLVLLPLSTITWTTDGTWNSPYTGCIILNEGVTLKGRSREHSKIVANISDVFGGTRILVYTLNGAHLENLTIEYTRSNDNAVCVFYSYGVVDTGITLKDVTIVAKNSGYDMDGISIQIPFSEDEDIVGIDNCSIYVEAEDGENFVETYGSSYHNTRSIIRNSTFIVINDEVGVVSPYITALYPSMDGDGKLLIDNCFAYAEVKQAPSSTSRVKGIEGSGNIHIKNTIAIAKNAGTVANTETIGIGLWSSIYPNYPDDDILTDLILVENCIGIAHSSSSSLSASYTTRGLEVGEGTLIGGYYRATCDGTSDQVHGGVIYADDYIFNLRNATFEGDTYDLVTDNGWLPVHIYGCQYETYYEQDGTSVFKGGDRASYYPESYHSEDIEDDDLTRHLPLPTISGWGVMATGDKWVLSDSLGGGVGSGAGVGAFLELSDTPSDYSGEVGKTIVVNATEDALEFTDVGAGDMTKAVYDTNANGEVDVSETAPWTGVTGKPSTYPPSTHTHDSRYYKETEIDLKFLNHDEFLDMDDTPTSYAGQARKALVVNETEDEVGFADIAGISSGLYNQVLTSSEDEYPDFIMNKFIAGSGIVLTELPGEQSGYEYKTLRVDTTWADAGAQDIGACVFPFAGPSIPSSTWTSIGFDLERWDTDDIHDTFTNNTRLTCKTAGKYAIKGNVFMLPLFGDPEDPIWQEVWDRRFIRIWLNDLWEIATDRVDGYRADTSGVYLHVDTIWDLEVGDYVELQVWHDSVGSLPAYHIGKNAPNFMMQLIEVGAGATQIIGLEDTPPTYSGAANKVLAVTPEEDGVEFVYKNIREVTTISGNYSLMYYDREEYDVVLCSGEGVIRLPSATEHGSLSYTFKRIDDGPGNVTLSGADQLQLIDGERLYHMGSQYDKVTIVSDGTEWWII